MGEAEPDVPLTTATDEQLPAEDRPVAGRGLEDAAALCLSGGGYRAMLFHLGTLWYLNERGWLRRLARISSVSGGSITAGVLGLAWKDLDFDAAGVGRAFAAKVVAPLRKLAGDSIDVNAIAGGLLGTGSVGDRLAKIYRKKLFGDSTLQSLPDAPRFVINATNIQSGALFRFSKPYIWDYRVGKVPDPKLDLGSAVAASSAFPPVLSPVTLKFPAGAFAPGTGKDLQRPPYTREVVLSDGGVYDNLGLETAWKRYGTILVSDGGGKLDAEEHPKSDWLQHSVRVLGVIDNQVRSLRKRQLVAALATRERKGAYWGIRTDVTRYPLADPLPCPLEKTLKLAGVATRLDALSAVVQERLINWGYAVCDAAMRAHVDPSLPRPAGFPFPAAGIG
jgi:NTE family protein